MDTGRGAIVLFLDGVNFYDEGIKIYRNNRYLPAVAVMLLSRVFVPVWAPLIYLKFVFSGLLTYGHLFCDGDFILWVESQGKQVVQARWDWGYAFWPNISSLFIAESIQRLVLFFLSFCSIYLFMNKLSIINQKTIYFFLGLFPIACILCMRTLAGSSSSGFFCLRSMPCSGL